MSTNSTVTLQLVDVLVAHRSRLQRLHSEYVTATARAELLESLLSNNGPPTRAPELSNSKQTSSSTVEKVDVDEVVSYTPTQIRDECEALFGNSGALGHSKVKPALLGAFEKERHPKALKADAVSTTRSKRSRTVDSNDAMQPVKAGPQQSTPQEYWDITFLPRSNDGKPT